MGLKQSRTFVDSRMFGCLAFGWPVGRFFLQQGVQSPKKGFVFE